MERSASVANIKCGEVRTYLPIYTTDYLLIGRYAPLFHARGFASGIFIYLFGFYSGAAIPSSIVDRTYIEIMTHIIYRQGYALLKNRKSY
jgi:hypothetical protein